MYRIIKFLAVPLISLFVLVILVFILSNEPFVTLYYFFIGPFGNIFSFGNMINNAILFVFGALGITIAMKAGNLNLGGEGQVYFGAFFAAIVAFTGFGKIGIILAITAGVLSAGTLAAFSGFCKTKWNINELITSFLVSCAVIPVVNYLVTGPFLDPDTSLLSTKKIPESTRLTVLHDISGINTSIFIAAVLVILVFFFINKTKTGYELRMTGINPMFARYGGIYIKLNTVMAMAISGGFYGLAGSLAILGIYHSVIKEFSSGLGWSALTVALLSGFSVQAIIPAAIFFAWIGAGSRIAMQNTGLTYEVALVIQAVILILCAALLVKRSFFTGEKN